MKILIVGGGGLGSVLAGYLAHAGTDVTLLVKPEQATQYERQQVQIHGAANFVAPVHVLSVPPPGAAFDYLLLCVKARDTDAALEPLHGLTVDALISFQNGAGKDEALARHFGLERVLGGLTYVAATRIRPGEARVTNPAGTFVGELDGAPSERAQQLVAALATAGLPATCAAGIVTFEWYKLAIFLRTALVSAITRLDVGALTQYPSLRTICAAVAMEVVRVAAAEGHAVPRHASDDFSLAGSAGPAQSSAAIDATEADMAAILDTLGQALRASGRSFYPSLAQDIIAGRPTELEATAGDVIFRAERHGLPVPALRTCTSLLRGIEAANAELPSSP